MKFHYSYDLLANYLLLPLAIHCYLFLVFFLISLLVLLSLRASLYTTCQTNHAGPVKRQCVSWDYLRLPLLTFLSAEPDWKPSWRLMRSGDPLCAHSPLRISPPCKNSKVKPWARPLLRGRDREGVGAELI